MTDRIALAILRKAHGVRGEASVESWSDDPNRFDDLKTLTLVSPDERETRVVTIESIREHQGRLLLKFKGIESPEEVALLRNWTIEVPIDQAKELGADEYYLHDLAGMTLVDREGVVRGKVREAYEGGGGILLDIERPNGRRYDLPFAAGICVEVDLAKKQIVVELPDGIEDLDRVAAVEDEKKKPEPEVVEAETAAPASEESANATAIPDSVLGPQFEAPRNRGTEEPEEPRNRSVLSPQPSALPPRLRIDFVTIFPKMFEPLLAEGVISRGVKQGLLDIRVWDLRDYATDRHRSTDDEAYGGGPGMVMLGEPVFRCVEAIRASAPESQPRIVMTTPKGRTFTQPVARELADATWVAILCGRYEGFDERVHDALTPDEISIGDFVVSGGELPAMLVADAMSRMIEGVVGNSGSVEEDSFFNGLLDYPHYTRPEELRGMRVPEILMSGHHENIRKWRKEQSLRATLERRPELLEKAGLDKEAVKILAKIRGEGKR
jgi:tRNA (guanine37-N1)-methyltransferase